ncbi:sugar 3,4-ketoisomerase [Methylobacterium sp. sgz302541]|uniref:sugar 3,4-ketoisomerase n=1 Tax=unclassified Methylobacterium TaxID=2615210 RepID=UPI003D350D0A
MDVIAGVQVLRQRVHADGRGSLVALEEEDGLPFPLERVFFMKVDKAGVERGGHANSCDEYIVPLTGSVVVEVDNGRESARIRLSDHGRGLWVRAGILIHLREFEAGTTLLVCASARYDETRHFARAQPHLAARLCPA